jgi:hypothetical protein
LPASISAASPGSRTPRVTSAHSRRSARISRSRARRASVGLRSDRTSPLG